MKFNGRISSPSCPWQCEEEEADNSGISSSMLDDRRRSVKRKFGGESVVEWAEPVMRHAENVLRYNASAGPGNFMQNNSQLDKNPGISGLHVARRNNSQGQQESSEEQLLDRVQQLSNSEQLQPVLPANSRWSQFVVNSPE